MDYAIRNLRNSLHIKEILNMSHHNTLLSQTLSLICGCQQFQTGGLLQKYICRNVQTVPPTCAQSQISLQVQALQQDAIPSSRVFPCFPGQLSANTNETSKWTLCLTTLEELMNPRKLKPENSYNFSLSGWMGWLAGQHCSHNHIGANFLINSSTASLSSSFPRLSSATGRKKREKETSRNRNNQSTTIINIHPTQHFE